MGIVPVWGTEMPIIMNCDVNGLKFPHFDHSLLMLYSSSKSFSWKGKVARSIRGWLPYFVRFDCTAWSSSASLHFPKHGAKFVYPVRCLCNTMALFLVTYAVYGLWCTSSFRARLSTCFWTLQTFRLRLIWGVVSPLRSISYYGHCCYRNYLHHITKIASIKTFPAQSTPDLWRASPQNHSVSSI